MHSRPLALASIFVASSGCTLHAPDFHNITDEAPATETTAVASSETSTSGDPATDPSDPTGAATTGSTGPDPGSTDEPEVAGPEIYGFTVEPSKIVKPGPVELALEVSDAVTMVELWHGETLLATVAPSDLPFVLDVTSQGTCQGAQIFTAVAHGLDGQKAYSPPADLFCELPYPGSEHYTTYLEGAESAIGTAVAFRPDGGVIVAGALDGSMMLWRLDSEGDPVAGWPKTIANWTLVPGLGGKDSTATAVAVGPTGAIIVGGYYKNGFASRRYIAVLNENGTLLGGEDPGLVDGEEISGLAASLDGHVVAAGSRRTTPVDQDPLYDAVVWGYPGGDLLGAERWMKPYQRPAAELPDMKNLRNERARAVLALPNGEYAVLGERDFEGKDQFIYTRSLIVRYSSGGDYLGQWTSEGESFAHDAILAGVDTGDGLEVAGWCRHATKNATQQICIQTFDSELAFNGLWPVSTPFGSAGLGVSHDRENRTVVASYTTLPGQTDAWVFATDGAGAPLGWQHPYDGDGGGDFAAAVACEPWGSCIWVGVTQKGGIPVLIASKRWP